MASVYVSVELQADTTRPDYWALSVVETVVEPEICEKVLTYLWSTSHMQAWLVSLYLVEPEQVFILNILLFTSNVALNWVNERTILWKAYRKKVCPMRLSHYLLSLLLQPGGRVEWYSKLVSSSELLYNKQRGTEYINWQAQKNLDGCRYQCRITHLTSQQNVRLA